MISYIYLKIQKLADTDFLGGYHLLVELMKWVLEPRDSEHLAQS